MRAASILATLTLIALSSPLAAQQSGSPVATAAAASRGELPAELRGIPLGASQREQAVAIHARFRALGLADSLAGRRDSVALARAAALHRQEMDEVRALLTPAQQTMLALRLSRQRVQERAAASAAPAPATSSP